MIIDLSIEIVGRNLETNTGVVESRLTNISEVVRVLLRESRSKVTIQFWTVHTLVEGVFLQNLTQRSAMYKFIASLMS
jgi:hypothetical protein